MKCELIFVLNDGTELIGKDKINSHLHLFPANILETMKPLFYDVMSKTTGWNISYLRVYQNGSHKTDLNVPPKNLSDPFGGNFFN